MNEIPPIVMKEATLSPLVAKMTEGYARWQERDRRCRRRRNVAVIAISFVLSVGVNAIALSVPMRYSSYSGSYGPDAAAVTDYLLSQK